MMNVPLVHITVSKFAITYLHTGVAVAMLVTVYVLMAEHVKVSIKYQQITLLMTTTLDINECLTNNGGCQHTCTNSIGSYACSCRTGYALDTDNHGCIGMCVSTEY